MFNLVTQESVEVKALVDTGSIKFASIGFEPTNYHSEQIPETLKHTLPKWLDEITVFDTWKLLEFSVVDIPANIDAERIKVKMDLLKDNLKMVGGILTYIKDEKNKNEKNKNEKIINKEVEIINKETINEPEIVEVTIEKAGRVFSKSNYESLKEILVGLTVITNQVNELVSQMETETPMEDMPKSLSIEEVKEQIIDQLKYEFDSLRAEIDEIKKNNETKELPLKINSNDLMNLFKGKQ